LALAFLHKRDAGSAVRLSVAIENGQVHQPFVENVSHDRRERLSAVDMRKAPVTGKAGTDKKLSKEEPQPARDLEERRCVLTRPNRSRLNEAA